MEETVFIQYTDPSQKGVNRETRRVIASYAASSRKRTKVAARIESLARPLVDISLTTARQQNESTQHNSGRAKQQIDDASLVTQEKRIDNYHFPRTVLDCFRNEPFNAYPIKAQSGISEAVDYFLYCFVPHNSSPFASMHGQNPWVTQYFCTATQEPVHFESMVAMMHNSHASQLRMLGLSTVKLDRAVGYHRGNALVELRKRLDSQKTCADNAAILTVLCFMSIDHTNQQSAGFTTHRTALNKMIELRGGIDCLGGKGFFKAGILDFETLYSFMNRSKPFYPSVKDNSFYCPMYTLKPGLCATITRVPQGLRELVCTQKFSTRLIHLLDKFSHAMNDIAEIREHNQESRSQQSSVLISDYMASKNDQPSIEKYLVMCCLLYVLEMHQSKYTWATTEAIFERTFDMLMEYFIAYAHQVDLALNGSTSSNIGSLLEVIFAFDWITSTESPPLLGSSTLSRTSPASYLPDEDNRFVLVKTEDQLQIYFQQDPATIHLLDHEEQERMWPDMAWNEVDQILTKLLWNSKLRIRWSECWQASKASALGAPGVLPWMLLSDRIVCFRSCTSTVPENDIETCVDKHTVAEEADARAARELNAFLEVF